MGKSNNKKNTNKKSNYKKKISNSKSNLNKKTTRKNSIEVKKEIIKEKDIKENNKMKKGFNKRKIYIIVTSVIAVLLLVGVYFLTKFKDATIELGNEIRKEDFVRYGGIASNIDIDLSKVNQNEVGEYDVKVKYFLFSYDLKVQIKDTTPPTLEVKNIYEPIKYEINVNDFVTKLEDKSKVDIKINNMPSINDFGDYPIIIVATDAYGNKTEKECTLSIGWIKKEFSIEVGNDIKKSDLLFDMKNKDTINQDDLDKINKEREGVYSLKSVFDETETIVKIEKTKDVTPPTLELKSVSIYEEKKINSVNDFIKKATDKGSKVTTKLLTNIDYKKIGSQSIKIEATDEDGNKTIKETTLKIIKDTKGPKFSGLSKMTVNKGTKINYKKGVTAYDDNFGNCSFEVNSSSVDTSKYGTYQVTYTSSDKLGNKTTAKRVIVVNHDKSDTNALVKSVANSLSSNAETIRDWVRNNIKYNTNNGGRDPIWYGLKNKIGNCIVHAYVFDALLKNKGYTTKIIWTTDKTHYWNMVYLNGKWVHMDSTPTSYHNKYSIMNDAQRYERLQGRNWNRSLWPKAE